MRRNRPLLNKRPYTRETMLVGLIQLTGITMSKKDKLRLYAERLRQRARAANDPLVAQNLETYAVELELRADGLKTSGGG